MGHINASRCLIPSKIKNKLMGEPILEARPFSTSAPSPGSVGQLLPGEGGGSTLLEPSTYLSLPAVF